MCLMELYIFVRDGFRIVIGPSLRLSESEKYFMYQPFSTFLSYMWVSSPRRLSKCIEMLYVADT